MSPATYLDDIVAAHRARRANDPADLGERLARAEASPPPRGFRAALGAASARGTLALIAEVKRRSPSKGALDAELDPAGLAQEYAAGGASALSVLTDEEYFGARPDDLALARAACPLPVLRKDFTVSELDVCEARCMGADAVLLIVAALDDDELARFAALAERLALDALVEVHDENELARALAVGATLVGVNQRDLTTFEVDPGRAERVGAAIPPGVVAVAESGIRGGEDAARLAAAGFDAILVGETLVTAPARAAALHALVGHRVTRRGG
ncbi:MAG TPA: indole-3-glycerol phosphate synthase TrpC [Acidimicrobiales bacterium]|nr:indole-3-glycerol phosphate synthase TrpC [Acidimicrobiales bacterium]